MRHYRLYGLTLGSDFPFTTPLLPATGPADLTFTLADGLGPRVRTDNPVHSQPPCVDGEHFAYVYRDGDASILRFSRVAEFRLLPDRIVCHLLDERLAWLVELRLLGPTMALWLELQGALALHASSVETDEGAVAFASGNRGGKTSLAVMFLQAGFRLLSDDITPIEVGADAVWARPGFPQLRLWPADVAREVGDPDRFPLAHPYYTKRRVPVSPQGIGAHCPDSRRLRAFYALTRDETLAAGHLEITTLPSHEAVRELLRHAFAGPYVDGLGLQPARLPRLARIVAAVSMRRVVHNLTVEDLPRLHAAVHDDLAAQSATRTDPDRRESPVGLSDAARAELAR